MKFRSALWAWVLIIGSACGGGSSGPAPLDRFVPFKWVDTSGGDMLPLAGDDAVETPLGFSFRYFGTNFDRVYASANGFVSFVPEGAGASENTPLPDPAVPNGVVAPFWDALALAAGSEIRVLRSGTAPNRTAVVEWSDVAHADADPAERGTFQVIFEEGGQVLFSYRDVDFGDARFDQGASASVGTENPSGTAGVAFSFDEPSLRPNTTLRFTAAEIGEEIQCTDLDGDGFSIDGGPCGRLDCNDADGAVHPGAPELCNGRDDDCDGVVDESVDADGDGFTICGGDCDDADAARSPGAVEICDGIDNDCDLTVDEGFDADGDGFTSCGGDCDDGDPNINPRVREIPGDEIDQNCNGSLLCGAIPPGTESSGSVAWMIYGGILLVLGGRARRLRRAGRAGRIQ